MEVTIDNYDEYRVASDQIDNNVIVGRWNNESAHLYSYRYVPLSGV